MINETIKNRIEELVQQAKDSVISYGESVK